MRINYILQYIQIEVILNCNNISAFTVFSDQINAALESRRDSYWPQTFER